ncbi:hypothetical protein MNEG_7063 [Monoraphidium neglectum]|uniref:Uncharacterized protein n=1 Tax=Monoraphidium neglectum TaxID=145388 RepID=A0A0D2MJU0_9CHLO|nr:hypothetical protein MNEG_7063 [Monoraphidium neglectum]KIZ00897.1 hypothetical protein MNEG_7063 [Monoraphidium neglectum]|eukprot:XP_013899916.1 hypothetical protein MNEG_7063 [Monoraphidium neglectum]
MVRHVTRTALQLLCIAAVVTGTLAAEAKKPGTKQADGGPCRKLPGCTACEAPARSSQATPAGPVAGAVSGHQGRGLLADGAASADPIGTFVATLLGINKPQPAATTTAAAASAATTAPPAPTAPAPLAATAKGDGRHRGDGPHSGGGRRAGPGVNGTGNGAKGGRDGGHGKGGKGGDGGRGGGRDACTPGFGLIVPSGPYKALRARGPRICQRCPAGHVSGPDAPKPDWLRGVVGGMALTAKERAPGDKGGKGGKGGKWGHKGLFPCVACGTGKAANKDQTKCE